MESAAIKPRLKASTARLMLAREMWARANNVDDCSVWDDDQLLSTIYDMYIEKADKTIREAMERGD